MTQPQQHIDDFFRSSEAAYTPDISLQDAHWQQFQLQLNVPPPAPSSGSGISNWLKLLGGLIVTGAIFILASRLLITPQATSPVVLPIKIKDTIPASAPVRPAAAKESKAADTVRAAVKVRATQKAPVNKVKAQPPRQRILESKDTIQHAAGSVIDYSVKDTVRTRQVKDSVRRLTNEHSYPLTDTLQLKKAAELKVVPATIALSVKPVELTNTTITINSSEVQLETAAPAKEAVPGRIRIRNAAAPIKIQPHKKPFVYNTGLLIFLIHP